MATEARRLSDGSESWDEDELDLAEIYAKYKPTLRQKIGHSAPAADVEDILHNAFLRLVRRHQRGELDLSRPLWPLLLTLAHRARIDYWRSRPKEMTSGHLVMHPDNCELPGEEFEVVQCIADAFATLRPREKRLLIRCVVEEAPRGDVAADEILSRDALNVAVSRARRRFRIAYLSAVGESGALAVWALVLRLRVRLSRLAGGEREDIVRLASGATAAAVAAVTLAVSSVATSSAELAASIGAPAPSAERLATSEGGPIGAHHSTGDVTVERVAARAVTGRRPIDDQRDRAGALGVKDVGSTLQTEPQNPSVGFYVGWDDPLGSGHMKAGTEFKCSGGRVATATCPLLRQVPGTDSEETP